MRSGPEGLWIVIKDWNGLGIPRCARNHIYPCPRYFGIK